MIYLASKPLISHWMWCNPRGFRCNPSGLWPTGWPCHRFANLARMGCHGESPRYPQRWETSNSHLHGKKHVWRSSSLGRSSGISLYRYISIMKKTFRRMRYIFMQQYSQHYGSHGSVAMLPCGVYLKMWNPQIGKSAHHICFCVWNMVYPIFCQLSFKLSNSSYIWSINCPSIWQ